MFVVSHPVDSAKSRSDALTEGVVGVKSRSFAALRMTNVGHYSAAATSRRWARMESSTSRHAPMTTQLSAMLKSGKW